MQSVQSKEHIVMQIKQHLPKGWCLGFINRVSTEMIGGRYRRSKYELSITPYKYPGFELVLRLWAFNGEMPHAYQIPEIIEKKVKERCIEQL